MRCPFCSENKSKVVDSRESAGGQAIRRRRECLACDRRYTTYERVEEVSLLVIKKGDRREAFDRSKILACLQRSCEKLPVSAEAISDLAESIEQEVREVHEREVSSRFIGELIMMRLRTLNKVAYVRYASIYREFREPQDFLDELKPLLSPDELGLGGAS